MNLRDHRVGCLPTLAYLPEFVTELEEASLLREIYSRHWISVAGRRLQNHGGVVLSKGLVKAKLPSWLSALVERISTQIGVFGPAGANHVLINCYKPGDGIMPHQDGPVYHAAVCLLSLGSPAILRFYQKQQEGEEAVAPQGLIDERGQAGTCCCCCAGAGPRPLASVVCEPRSLLVFSDDAYSSCLHGIDFTREEVVDGSCVNAEHCGLRPGDVLLRAGERTSLTVRRVLRTSGLSIRL